MKYKTTNISLNLFEDEYEKVEYLSSQLGIGKATLIHRYLLKYLSLPLNDINLRKELSTRDDNKKIVLSMKLTSEETKLILKLMELYFIKSKSAIVRFLVIDDLIKQYNDIIQKGYIDFNQE